MKKKSVKISIPMCIYETITENARSSGFSTEEYMNYLAYKDNFFTFLFRVCIKKNSFINSTIAIVTRSMRKMLGK